MKPSKNGMMSWGWYRGLRKIVSLHLMIKKVKKSGYIGLEESKKLEEEILNAKEEVDIK